MNIDVLGGFTEFYKEFFVTGVGVPIDVTEIVTGGIGAVVTKIKCRAQVPAASFSRWAAAQSWGGTEAELFQTTQKGFVENWLGGHVWLAIKEIFSPHKRVIRVSGTCLAYQPYLRNLLMSDKIMLKTILSMIIEVIGM